MTESLVTFLQARVLKTSIAHIYFSTLPSVQVFKNIGGLLDKIPLSDKDKLRGNSAATNDTSGTAWTYQKHLLVGFSLEGAHIARTTRSEYEMRGLVWES